MRCGLDFLPALCLHTPHPEPEDSIMVKIRVVLMASGFAFAVCGTALAQTAAKPMQTVQMPVSPEPVAVVLKPATTAVLVSDMIDPTCQVQPKCTTTMVPAIAGLLAQARKAGVMVVHATRAGNAAKFLPETAPAPGDPVIASFGQDRFYNTKLDETLKARGITTVVLTGWKISGSVLYTSIGATLRDYTVVIPKDASLAGPDYEEAIGVFQILNQNSANAANEPLKPKASTLSRTNMITFQ
jgi:nicotinamidase-related amidase